MSRKRIGGRWRQAKPIRFFAISLGLSFLIFIIGTFAVGIGDGTPGRHQANPLVGAIGDGLATLGFLLIALFLILAIKDVLGYLLSKISISYAVQRSRHARANREVSVLMVGYSGAGKTLLLASLYEQFVRGSPVGIRLVTDDRSNKELTGHVTTICETAGFPLGTALANTRRWTFTVRVESRHEVADAFRLSYLDYAGGNLDALVDARIAESPDPLFTEALQGADVIMGILDGDQLAKIMRNGYDSGAVGKIERLLNILVRSDRPNIHLIISKWDLMRDSAGEYYSIGEILDRLSAVSAAFRDFRHNPRLGRLRVIPLAALGTNGFVKRTSSNGVTTMSKSQGVRWSPWNVSIPFYCAVPDILAHDIRERPAAPPGKQGRDGETSRGSRVAYITLSVLAALSISFTFSLGGVLAFALPVQDVLRQIRDRVADENRRGMAPNALHQDAAISYVLHECYSVLEEFEKQWPDSVIEPSVGTP